MRSSTGTWLRAPRLPPDVALTVRAHDHTGLGPPPTKPHCAGQRRDLLVQTRRCSFPRTTRQPHRPVGNRCFNAATISISCNRESCSRPISTCSSRASRPNSASAFPSPLRIFSPSVGNDFQQTRGNERFGHFQISRISHPYGGRPPLDVASRVHAVGASKNTCSSVCVVVSWHPPTEARILLDA